MLGEIRLSGAAIKRRNETSWSDPPGTDDRVPLDITIGASYADAPHKVRRVAIAAAQTMPRVLSTPVSPVCQIIAFADSNVGLILRFRIIDTKAGQTNVHGGTCAAWPMANRGQTHLPFGAYGTSSS